MSFVPLLYSIIIAKCSSVINEYACRHADEIKKVCMYKKRVLSNIVINCLPPDVYACWHEQLSIFILRFS